MFADDYISDFISISRSIKQHRRLYRYSTYFKRLIHYQNRKYQKIFFELQKRILMRWQLVEKTKGLLFENLKEKKTSFKNTPINIFVCEHQGIYSGTENTDERKDT